MAFGSLVQADAVSARNQNTITNTLSSTPTENNLLVLVRGTGGSFVTRPTGYLTAYSFYDSTSDDYLVVYYKIAGASESTSLSSTSTSGTEDYGIFIEVEGPWDTSDLLDDNGAGTVGTSTTCDTGSLTTVNSDTYVLAAGWWRHGNGETPGTVMSVSDSFTLDGTYGYETLQFKTLCWAYRVLTSTATTSPDFTTTASLNTDRRFGLQVSFVKGAANVTVSPGNAPAVSSAVIGSVVKGNASVSPGSATGVATASIGAVLQSSANVIQPGSATAGASALIGDVIKGSMTIAPGAATAVATAHISSALAERPESISVYTRDTDLAISSLRFQ